MNFPNPYLSGYGSPYMTPQFQQPMQQQYQNNMIPTLGAEIGQAENDDVINNYSVDSGKSQLFIMKDDSKIVIKSNTQNGVEVVEYTRAPKKKAPEYVTVEQLQAMLKELGLGKGAEE